MNRYWGHFPQKPSLSARRHMASATAARLGRKKRLEGISVQGRKIAVTWWGQSWNHNLERYADYSNRIARGRSYVTNGLVIDLRVFGGHVSALVAGSSSDPYEVRITVRPLPAKKAAALAEKARGAIESVEALLEGAFPEGLKELLFAEEGGLFPRPSEIKFECTCPDWARMCKHVAAALYGIGNRLDSRPDLFFVLRGIDAEKFAGKMARRESRRLLAQSAPRGGRIISGADISRLFDVHVRTSGNRKSGRPKRSG